MKCLKEFRISLGYTIQQIAISMGVSKSLYEKVEMGFRKPSSSFISKLKKTYPQFDINIFFIKWKHETWKNNKCIVREQKKKWEKTKIR